MRNLVNSANRKVLLESEMRVFVYLGSLKLTDFDEAVYFEPGKKMRGSVYATKAYAAPETFEKEYKYGSASYL